MPKNPIQEMGFNCVTAVEENNKIPTEEESWFQSVSVEESSTSQYVWEMKVQVTTEEGSKVQDIPTVEIFISSGASVQKFNQAPAEMQQQSKMCIGQRREESDVFCAP